MTEAELLKRIEALERQQAATAALAIVGVAYASSLERRRSKTIGQRLWDLV